MGSLNVEEQMDGMPSVSWLTEKLYSWITPRYLEDNRKWTRFKRYFFKGRQFNFVKMLTVDDYENRGE
jgi:hypothetical protein